MQVTGSKLGFGYRTTSPAAGKAVAAAVFVRQRTPLPRLAQAGRRGPPKALRSIDNARPIQLVCCVPTLGILEASQIERVRQAVVQDRHAQLVHVGQMSDIFRLQVRPTLRLTHCATEDSGW
jgi:hypothetical protein